MEKILLGVAHSKGEMDKDGKKYQYDNMVLYCVDYDEPETVGFSYAKGVEPVKVRTSEFFEICGVSPRKFIEEFQEKYMYHKLRERGSLNKYKRYVVDEITFSGETCFEIAERREKEASESFEADDPFNADYDDNSKEVNFADEFEEDVATGTLRKKKE